ncbi:hypothetical protein TIFTF001_004791 [Ficus carica]|uniref:Uncharacterized protein n=1 Tax=Ficus carica TaxID=3494 RepID=A0AA88CYG7_FICCA|nr:hypothetical protein TIFTF001_004791 [Ficus carica]
MDGGANGFFSVRTLSSYSPGSDDSAQTQMTCSASSNDSLLPLPGR